MGLKKKTIKLVTKVLSDEKRRKLYTEGDINFMERQLVLLKAERERRKRQKELANERG